MDLKSLTGEIQNTCDQWLNTIEYFDFDILVKKPGREIWSIGQVVKHIIQESKYYISQVEICVNSNDNISGLMKSKGRKMFEANSFPDIQIKRDDLLSQSYPQPQSKTGLIDEMYNLKFLLLFWAGRLEINSYNGKTQHPGLGYFNALEWLQFTEMHMRHHLRQKDRILHLIKLP